MRRAPIAALLLALSVALIGAPTPVQASATTDAEMSLLRWINQARADRGLVSLTGWRILHDVSGYRAQRMANQGTLNHTIAGDLATQLNATGADWYRYGETIGWSSSSNPLDAARALYRAWRGSTAHWALLMSSRFNYVGAGLGLRAANGRTYGAIVLTESNDHSPPTARLTGVGRSGNDVTWSWTGADRRLQTHTAGLRDYDVDVRTDSGSWVRRLNDTTRTSLTLNDLAGGHTYRVRVRATDRRGNVGPWSSTLAATVP
jgi:uncharacterized protein YkwD